VVVVVVVVCASCCILCQRGQGRQVKGKLTASLSFINH
jgi:hypothetical protein